MMCGRDGRMLAARVEQKNEATKHEKNGVINLDKESPIQAVCGQAARTVLGGGRAMKRASLPLLRREFITLLGSAAVVWPLAARGQQPGGMRRIGVIGPRPENAGFNGSVGAGYPAMLDELRKLGFSEIRNLVVEYR